VKSYEQIANKMIAITQISFLPKTLVVLCRSHKQMEKIADQTLPEWVLAIAIPTKSTIAINHSKIHMPENSLTAVVRHEACHLYLGTWEQKYHRILPLWFNEGIAEWVSGALHMSYQEQLLDSIAFHQTIDFKKLRYQFPASSKQARQAYLQALNMIEYLVKEHGTTIVKKILSQYAHRQDFNQALLKSVGMNLQKLQQSWLKHISPSSIWLWIWKITRLFSIFTIMAILVIWAYLRQRKKARQLRAQWEQEEDGVLLFFDPRRK